MPRRPNPNTFLKRLAEDPRATEKQRCDALADLAQDAPIALLLRLLRSPETLPAVKAKAIEIYDLFLEREKSNVTIKTPASNAE